MKNNDNQLRRACSLLRLEAFLSKQVQGPSVQGKALHQPPGVSAGLSGPAAGRLQPAPAVPAVTELCTRSPGTLEIPSFTTPQRRREIAPWSGRGSRPGGHVRDFSKIQRHIQKPIVHVPPMPKDLLTLTVPCALPVCSRA